MDDFVEKLRLVLTWSDDTKILTYFPELLAEVRMHAENVCANPSGRQIELLQGNESSAAAVTYGGGAIALLGLGLILCTYGAAAPLIGVVTAGAGAGAYGLNQSKENKTDIEKRTNEAKRLANVILKRISQVPGGGNNEGGAQGDVQADGEGDGQGEGEGDGQVHAPSYELYDITDVTVVKEVLRMCLEDFKAISKQLDEK